jgi:chaperone modulatory protein CbpM
MRDALVVTGVCLDEQTWLELDELALACGVESTYVVQLVDEGLVMPQAAQPPWRFTGEALARVRRIRRLQRDFEANLQSVAVMLDLLDEIERLRAQLQRAGLQN